MGRLIDADAFVKEYSQISEKFRNNEIMRMMIDHFIDAVKTFPTTYDVDKVVEEIKSLSGYEIYKETFELIIDIVRKGGV